MTNHCRFKVTLSRSLRDGEKRITLRRTVYLPFSPTVGLELQLNDDCTFVVDRVSYSLETGAFLAIDGADRLRRMPASSGALESWLRAGFSHVATANGAPSAHPHLHLVRNGPP